MSKSTPSLLALLGLVAFAGYQNRGRLSEMLADARQKAPGSSPDRQYPDGQHAGDSQDGGFLSEIGRMFGAGASGGTLASGLSDLVNRFKDSGRAGPAESWVSTNPNRPLDVSELESAIGIETLDELSQKTGLSRAQLLLRLNAALPEVVNRFTPDGRLPTETEARHFD
ncbi:YidB family protein [Paracoccaceae bacterium Fryx2]|nr:YidB family protein [Paracoccaceae bacterium Fryx2]